VNNAPGDCLRRRITGREGSLAPALRLDSQMARSEERGQATLPYLLFFVVLPALRDGGGKPPFPTCYSSSYCLESFRTPLS
jgi:hypothetical protein